MNARQLITHLCQFARRLINGEDGDAVTLQPVGSIEEASVRSDVNVGTTGRMQRVCFDGLYGCQVTIFVTQEGHMAGKFTDQIGPATIRMKRRMARTLASRQLEVGRCSRLQAQTCFRSHQLELMDAVGAQIIRIEIVLIGRRIDAMQMGRTLAFRSGCSPFESNHLGRL